MREELRNHIVEENYYYDLLTSNPQYKPQGRNAKLTKIVVGIIQGNPEDYKSYHHLDFKYFDSWKEAYTQLSYNGGFQNVI